MTAPTTTAFECVHCGQPCHIDGAFTDPRGRGDVCGDCIAQLAPMLGGAFPTSVTAETMRARMTKRWTSSGWTDPEPATDLRGRPIGDRAQVWEYERLVEPRPSKRRRGRIGRGR